METKGRDVTKNSIASTDLPIINSCDGCGGSCCRETPSPPMLLWYLFNPSSPSDTDVSFDELVARSLPVIVNNNRSIFMNNEAPAFFFGLFAATVIFGVVFSSVNSGWKAEAIKRGHAQYNPQTAAFEWLEKKAEQP
jgi:hypothetical protein